MVHSVDIGRGIIGVIDVTDVMVIIPCDHTSIISSSRCLACASTRPKIPMPHFLQVGVFKFCLMRMWEVQDFGNGKVGVLNNKQGFTDSDRFSKLEKWLDETFDCYWDENFDQYGVMKTEDLLKGEHLHLDDQWVQCNKCMKWRILPKDWNADLVLGDW